MNRRDPLDLLASTALLPMARRAGLRARLGLILDGDTDRRPVPTWAIAIALAGTAALVPLLASVRFTRADPPPPPTATEPTTARAAVDAAALVREVRASEQWVDHVDSFRYRILDTWSAPHPQPDQGIGSGLTEVGFDRHRLYKRFEIPGPDVFISVWDGQLAWGYERYPNAQPMSTVGGKSVVSNDLYGLNGGDLKRVAGEFGGSLAWGRAGRHEPWWLEQFHEPDYWSKPEDFRVIGRTTYGVHDCYILYDGLTPEVWYVGISDHRLYALAEFCRPASVTDAQTLDAEEHAARHLGHVVHGKAAFDAWEKTLTPAEGNQFWNVEYPRAARALATMLTSLFWCDDYRQVAPGCWFPMHQGYDLFDANHGKPGDPPTDRRDERIVDVAVNQPLPESWFARDWAEGVPVNDWGHKPPLMYRYKKHFTPAEWQVVLDEANARQASADAREKELHSAIGHPAAEFPSTWVQGTPITLADLKGKVTLVAFWANWCAPCRNDVGRLNAFAGQADSTGVGVLSVHAAGTSVDDVRKAIADEKITYPVCLDAGKDNWKGPVFAAAHIVQLPSAMAIDRDGTIAAVGDLSDVWNVAVKRAAAKAE